MKFKVGDKVLPTKELLLKLPNISDKLKDGGIIISVGKTDARIQFYSGFGCCIYLSSLKPLKNHQLKFSFMP